MSATAPRRSGWLPRLALRRMAAALVAATLVGACDGDNMFGGPNAKVAQAPPVITHIDAPSVADEGSSFELRVRAFAVLGATKIDVRFKGAFADQRSFTIEKQTDTARITTVVNLPAEALDSVLTIEATVTDRAGRVSEPLVRTVWINDKSAPVVTATVTPAQASAGDTIRILVTARDNVGVTAVGYVLLNAAGDTVGSVVTAPAGGAAVEHTFVVPLSQALPPAQLRVVGIGVNTAQVRGYSPPAQLNVLDLLPPTVRILNPRPDESFPLSDSLLVRVQVSDSNGVGEVRLRGVAIRRDSLQNTTVVTRYAEKVIPLPGPLGTAPRDTTLVRYLIPTPVDVSEHVFIVAEARDLAGNLRADTVRIVDGPRVQVMNPVDGGTVAVNRALLVHIVAADRVAGLDSLKLLVTGVVRDSIRLRNLGGREALDTTLTIATGSVTGAMTLQPLVWNRRGTGGAGPAVRVTVSSSATTDTEAPLVSRRITSPERVELGDSIRVTVRATDGTGSGLKRMGAVITLIPDSEELPRRTVYRSSPVFDPPLSGSPERVFSFALGELYSELETTFPRKFAMEVHAFAVDAADNCGASVSDQLTREPCQPHGGYYTAAGVSPAHVPVTATKGKSVGLPGGGRIADAVVDATRRRIYLSNIQNNKVDIFHLDADTFATTNSQTRRGLVGAAPWGLVISNSNDSLFVANSGGTNISVLPLNGPGYMIEDVPRRILTPNVVLFDVRISETNGFTRYAATVHDFSDRPQYIAQHQTGTLVYSTLPTPAARDGTLRYLDRTAGPLPEAYLLHRGAVRDVENSFAIGNLDSIKVARFVGAPDLVMLFDCLPGSDRDMDCNSGGSALIQSPLLPLDQALEYMAGEGSDVEWYPGAWNIPSVGLGDTTYVAASTDRSTIVFGEGARAPYGRVILCCTVLDGPPVRLGLSNEIAVGDLVRNAAERVFGVGLNADGSLGVARGANAAYFFTRDLRLQGEFRSGMAGGAGGASLHPQHADRLETGDRALAFVATAQRTIKILDSAHFFERGEIPIRNNVVGPMRAVQPTANDNQGRLPSDPNYIVVRLIAVTDGANVVVIDVRRKDISQ